MKRTLTLITLLALALLLPLALASCGQSDLDRILALSGEEQAAALIETVDKKAEADTSREESLTMSGKMTVNGVTADFSATGSALYLYPSEEGEGYRESTRTETAVSVTVNGEKIPVEDKMTYSGFCDDKMFLSEQSGDMKAPTFLWSPITQEEYLAHRKEQNDGGLGIDMADFTTRSCTYSAEDKVFTLVMTDLDEEALTACTESLFDGADEMPALENVVATYTVGEDFLPRTAELRLVFADSDEVMTATCTYRYTDLTFDEELEFREVNKSADLRLLDWIQEGMEKFKEAEEGNYRFLTKINGTVSSQTVTSYQETDLVHFSTDENGKLCFNIKVTVGNTEATVTYENGIRTTETAGADPVSEEITEEEARQMLLTQLNNGNFGSCIFSHAVALNIATGRYSFEIAEPDTSSYESLAAQVGGSIVSADGRFNVTYKDGKLKSWEYTLEFTIKSGSNHLNMTVYVGITPEYIPSGFM